MQGMACTNVGFLLKGDPHHSWDNQNSKRGSSYPRDSRRSQSREPLWSADPSHNLSGVQAQSRSSGGDFCVWEVGCVDGRLTLHQEFHDHTALLHFVRACGKQRNLHKGRRIHADILKGGLLEHDIYVGTALLHMYAKCGALAKAQGLFDELQARDVASWNALIAGYAQHGFSDRVLNCFGQMQDKGFSPDAVTFVYILKACSSIGAVEKGKEIHAKVGKQGLLEKDFVLGTALVDMYAKCGALTKAREVFDELSARDAASWNSIIAGYAQHGHGDEALNCFGRMREEGHSPNAVTFVGILKACGSIGAAQKGEEIHAEVDRQGLLRKDIVLGTALVDMYAKCGVLAKAQKVFNELPARDVASWNALMAGYAQQGLGHEALNCFEQMLKMGLYPNAVSFVCGLKACGSIGAVERGEVIHAEISRQGLLERNVVLGNALVDMYAKCGALAKAQEVFDELLVRDVASWNSLIAGYAEHGLGDEALNCFRQMEGEGLSPNAVTFVCILKACGSIGAAKKGEEIHAGISKLGLFEKHFVLGTALVDMYAKCGALTKAQEVFEELPVKNVVSWNALMAGYAQHGLSDEVLNCFECMQDEGVSPDSATFVCILKAYGSIGAIEKGEEIHAEVSREGLLGKSCVLSNALIDMYAKCGVLAKAQEVFDELPARDSLSWTTLIAAYAQHGNMKKVFDLFRIMIEERIEPDMVTFGVLLTACCHAGLVEEGQMYFGTMTNVYCIIPTVEHHMFMIDLLSRAGHFDKAIRLIENVPPPNCLRLWLTLLGACQKWVNVELGRWAFEHAVQFDRTDAAAYICMSNLYAAAGMQEESDTVEALRMKNGAWKIPRGCWWTDISRSLHSFTAGNMSIFKNKCIYTTVEDIGKKLRLEGYSQWLAQAISDDRKDHLPCGPAEKLAIACALIKTSHGTPIRVIKNTRLCGDCHFATASISKMERRKIQVKDAYCIHIFEDGKRMCDEYG